MDTRFRLFPLLIFLALAGAVGAEPIVPVDTATAGFVGLSAQGPFDQPVVIGSYEEFAAVFGASTVGLANPYLAPSVAGYFANGGVRLAVVRVSAIDDDSVIGIDGGEPGQRTGLQALLDVDDVSAVAIPGVTTAAVQAAMIAHCESAGDRLAILDSASPDDPVAVQTQRSGLVTAEGHAALYFPWLQAAPAGTSLLLPPSGFVAGSFAGHEPPDSPVGLITTATGVAYSITPAEQDLLNAQNINAIRDLSGIRIWGARTLAVDVEWQYISVRRMALFIAESVAEGTAWCLAEDNDAFLWAALEQDVDLFLYDLYLSGWLQGATPNEAYFDLCGLSTTMTALDISEGRTILLLGFAAIRPAEFTVLRIVHQRPDAATTPNVLSRLPHLLPPVPNPFNPLTNLRFELATKTRVNLHIFDLAGRQVRTILADRTLASGIHQHRWDGRDDAGRGLSSGVYLVRLQTAVGVQSQRIVLVR